MTHLLPDHPVYGSCRLTESRSSVKNVKCLTAVLSAKPKPWRSCYVARRYFAEYKADPAIARLVTSKLNAKTEERRGKLRGAKPDEATQGEVVAEAE